MFSIRGKEKLLLGNTEIYYFFLFFFFLAGDCHYALNSSCMLNNIIAINDTIFKSVELNSDIILHCKLLFIYSMEQSPS